MTKRRDFFKHFFSHLYILKEEALGHRHFRLSDLWKLDNTKFRQLKFRVREGVSIQFNEGDIRFINNKDESIFLCAVGTEEEKMFHFMQRRMTVGEMVDHLVQTSEFESGGKFSKVREFMLSLVNQMVCVPAVDVHCEQEDKQREGEI